MMINYIRDIMSDKGKLIWIFYIYFDELFL